VIKEPSNHKGLLSRSGVIRSSRFDRARHYIPVGSGDYSSLITPYLKNESDRDRVLFCADWTNELRGWNKALIEAVRTVRSVRTVQKVEMVLWIPSDYFEVSAVVQTITDFIKGGKLRYGGSLSGVQVSARVCCAYRYRASRRVSRRPRSGPERFRESLPGSLVFADRYNTS